MDDNFILGVFGSDPCEIRYGHLNVNHAVSNLGITTSIHKNIIITYEPDYQFILMPFHYATLKCGKFYKCRSS